MTDTPMGLTPDEEAEWERHMNERPPSQSEEEAHYDNIAGMVKRFVVNVRGILTTVDEMIDAGIGGRMMMQNLRDSLSVALAEFDPDDDDGHDDPHYPY